MKVHRLRSDRRRWIAFALLIVWIVGMIPQPASQVRAAEQEQQKEPTNIVLVQGSRLSRTVFAGEEMRMPLQVEKPNKALIYSWEIQQAPEYGTLSLLEHNTSAEALYTADREHSGRDTFAIAVSAPGKEREVVSVHMQVLEARSGTESEMLDPAISTSQFVTPIREEVPAVLPPVTMENQITAGPVITAYPDYNQVVGYGWPTSTMIEIEIDDVDNGAGVDYSDSKTSDSGGDVQFYPPFQIGPGDIIEMTDTISTKTMTIQNLSLQGWDLVADTVFGTAENGVIEISGTDGGPYENGTSPVVDGLWTYTFTTVDVREGTEGYLWQTDPDGDLTRISWNIPDPKVSVTWNMGQIEGRNWPKDTEVGLSIDGVFESASNSGDYGTAYFYTDWEKLMPGTEINLSGGGFSVTHEVINLAVTDADIDTDILTGTAQPDKALVVYAYNGTDSYDLVVSANSAGAWSANFSSKVNLLPGTSIWLNQEDANGNSTHFSTYIPDPKYTVSFDGSVYGDGWPMNTDITLTIGLLTYTQNSGSYGDVYFYMDSDTIVPGTATSMSGGGYLKEHEIIDLTITDINTTNETISGTGLGSSSVWVQVQWNSPNDFPTAADGTWMADLSATYDLEPGISGSVKQEDGDGDATEFDWRIPAPQFVAYPEEGYISGENWPNNTEIFYLISHGEDLSGSIKSDYYGQFYLDVSSTYLTAGAEVTLSADAYGKHYEEYHEVRDLVISDVDEAANILYGTCGLGDLEVYAEDLSWNDETLYPIPSGNNWEAHFTGVDIGQGTDGYVRQTDGGGNATQIYFYFPNPNLTVMLDSYTIEGNEWEPYSLVTLSIDGSTWKNIADEDGEVDFEVYPFALHAGQEVTMSDGTSTEMHVIRKIAITSLDMDNDIVSGTANEGKVYLSRCKMEMDGWWCSGSQFDVDSSETWSADLSSGYDLKPGSFGELSQRDEKFNYTETTWLIPDPTIGVWLDDQVVEGGFWQAYDKVTLTIGALSLMDVTNQRGEINFRTWSSPVSARQIVSMDDGGTYSKSHEVRNLSFSAYDRTTNILTGTANPGDVTIIGYSDVDYGEWIVTANISGNWSLDLNGKMNPGYSTWFDVYQYDEDGDYTALSGSYPVVDPIIAAYPVEDRVHCDGWTPLAPITLTIGTQIWTSTVDEYGSAYFYLSPFDLKADQNVQVSDGVLNKSHIVIGLDVTTVDPELYYLSGTANPGDLYIWVCTPETCQSDYIVVDGTGDWTYPVSYGFEMVPGTEGGLEQSDSDGDYTSFYWYLPDPIIEVNPYNNDVGISWLPGNAEVILTIGTHSWTGQSDVDGDAYFAVYPFNIRAGHVVQVTCGEFAVQHTVFPLGVTSADLEAEVLTGKAAAERIVNIRINNPFSYNYSRRNIITDDSGNWTINVGLKMDLQTGSSGWVEQYDDEGHSTWINFSVPLDPNPEEELLFLPIIVR